jgi:hypothetical protein
MNQVAAAPSGGLQLKVGAPDRVCNPEPTPTAKPKTVTTLNLPTRTSENKSCSMVATGVDFDREVI